MRLNRLPLEVQNAFEDLETYVLTELEKRGGKRFRFVWEDRLVGLMVDFGLALAEANAADAKGAARRLAIGRAERLFYLVCLTVRKGFRLGALSERQYKAIAAMIAKTEALFIPWATKYNQFPAFIRKFAGEGGKVEFDRKTFSRVVQ